MGAKTKPIVTLGSFWGWIGQTSHRDLRCAMLVIANNACENNDVSSAAIEPGYMQHGNLHLIIGLGRRKDLQKKEEPEFRFDMLI